MAYSDNYTNRSTIFDAGDVVEGDHVKSIYDELGSDPAGSAQDLTTRLNALDTQASAETVRDTIAAFITAGNGITVTHDDAANTLTITANSSGGGGGDPTPTTDTLVGIMGLTETQYDYMKAKVAANEQPWKGMYDRMAAGTDRSLEIPASTGIAYRAATSYSSTSYSHRAVAEIQAMAPGFDTVNGPKGGWQLLDDAIAARVHALLFAFTGSTTSRDLAISILNAWATTCTNVVGKTKFAGVQTDPSPGNENARLYVAWAIPSLCQAADIIRCKSAGAWTSSEYTAFGDWMKDVLLPRCEWASYGNWDAGFTEAFAHVAAFRRDDALMTYAVNRFEDRIRTSIHMAGDSFYQKRARWAFNPPWPWAGGYGPPGVTVPSDFTLASADYRYSSNTMTSFAAYAQLHYLSTYSTATDAFWSATVNNGVMGEMGRDVGHAFQALAQWSAAAETMFHYGRTEPWTNHRERIRLAYEKHSAWLREVLKDAVDNNRGSGTVLDAYYDANPYSPTGVYNPSTGASDSSGPAWPYDLDLTLGGDQLDECFNIAVTAISERAGVAMPNTEAVLTGWTESSVNYGNLHGSPGGVRPGPRGPKNARWLESLTSYWVNDSVVSTPPTAQFTATFNGLTVDVDATSSSLGTGSSFTAYNWDWGDGNSTNGSDPTVSHTYTTAGPHTITLEVIDDDTLSDTETKELPQVFAYDAFGRTDTVDTGRTWGAATIGGTWTAYPTTGNTQAGVNGSEGVIYLPDATHSNQFQYLTTPSTSDFTMFAKLNVVDMPTAGDVRLILYGRHSRTGATINNSANCEFRFDMDTPKLQIIFSQTLAGTTSLTNAADVSGATLPTDGEQFCIKYQQIGDVAYAKYWIASTSEPATWTRQATITGILTTAGGFSVFAFAQGSYNAFPLQVEIDEFWCHDA